MRMHMKQHAGVLFSLLVLTSCSDDEATPAASGADTTLSGKLIDSTVSNIGYKTETQSGVTSNAGVYKYKAGETVTFFIGNLEFPSTSANSIVTALDLARTADKSDAAVINMNRLLLSLDEDGDPDNGIQITEAAKTSAAAIDFSLPVSSFETDTNLVNLVNNGGQTIPGLVSVESATNHFNDTLAEISATYSTEEYRMTYTPYSTDKLPTPCQGRAVSSHNLILTTAVDSDNQTGYGCSLADVPQTSCIAYDLVEYGIYYDFGTSREDNIRGSQLLLSANNTLTGKWIINIDESIGGGTTDCGTVTGTKQ